MNQEAVQRLTLLCERIMISRTLATEAETDLADLVLYQLRNFGQTAEIKPAVSIQLQTTVNRIKGQSYGNR